MLNSLSLWLLSLEINLNRICMKKIGLAIIFVFHSLNCFAGDNKGRENKIEYTGYSVGKGSAVAVLNKSANVVVDTTAQGKKESPDYSLVAATLAAVAKQMNRKIDEFKEY